MTNMKSYSELCWTRENVLVHATRSSDRTELSDELTLWLKILKNNGRFEFAWCSQIIATFQRKYVRKWSIGWYRKPVLSARIAPASMCLYLCENNNDRTGNLVTNEDRRKCRKFAAKIFHALSIAAHWGISWACLEYDDGLVATQHRSPTITCRCYRDYRNAGGMKHAQMMSHLCLVFAESTEWIGMEQMKNVGFVMEL